METWQSVLIAVAAMTAFALVVVVGVLAIMYFLNGSLAARLRNLRRR